MESDIIALGNVLATVAAAFGETFEDLEDEVHRVKFLDGTAKVSAEFIERTAALQHLPHHVKALCAEFQDFVKKTYDHSCKAAAIGGKAVDLYLKAAEAREKSAEVLGPNATKASLGVQKLITKAEKLEVKSRTNSSLADQYEVAMKEVKGELVAAIKDLVEPVGLLRQEGAAGM